MEWQAQMHPGDEHAGFWGWRRRHEHHFGPGGPAGPGDEGGHGPFGGHGGHGGRGGRRAPFGDGFPGFGGFRFGRGPQVERGGVRTALLRLLSERPMHGYEMIRELSERSGGAWRPSPGSVYPVLQLLEDEGLVRAQAKEDGRRVYELTADGRAIVQAQQGERMPWDQAASRFDGGARPLLGVARQVLGAVHQVVQAGDAAQIAQAREVLTNTRRALYRILAEDSPSAEQPSAATPDETLEF
jgi:DNA-binding PadR family transcriptional regulator